MKLIAFFSEWEIFTIGLVEGEPTKGPLLKIITSIKPQELLLVVKGRQTWKTEALSAALPKDLIVKELRLEVDANAGMSPLVNALRAHTEQLKGFKDAVIMNAGTPQERAALWLLKHDGILEGAMVEPPTDYDFIPTTTPRTALRVAEPAKEFETKQESFSWETVAKKVGCVGKSPRFRQTLMEAFTLAGHSAPILLVGETGCGKEVLAHFIHEGSRRADKPFVAVNCAALPETLAESILFGHEKGAFTGAYKRQSGKFEQANGGTLFLDELGELSLGNQAKLLRAIESHCVDPLGGTQSVPVDVRLIGATNRNLAQEVAMGRFREDLYYRLRSGEIEIPPLRERSGDIPLIALHILERFNSTFANPKQFSKSALEFLETQSWEGNVRDLLNTIERAALMCPRTIIAPEDFRIRSAALRPASKNTDGLPTLFSGFSMEEYLQKTRRALFEKALKQSGGNKSEAARLLGISPQAMHKFLKQGQRAKTEK
jgi:DNA-binding NtrC family response regulator